MFLTFSTGRNPRRPADHPLQTTTTKATRARQESTNRNPITITQSPVSPPQHATTRPPSYAIAVEIFVEAEPESSSNTDGETWIVDKKPQRPLARGQVATLRTNTHVIGSARVSKVASLTRHWAILRLAGGKTGMRLRVPIPWVHLCKMDSYKHTTLYHTLPLQPDPHDLFRLHHPFNDTDVNPYEFDITEADEDQLRSRLQMRPLSEMTLAPPKIIEHGDNHEAPLGAKSNEESV
ncbi:uncharacterized protein C8Q71DRAFT_862229 [Rhodofomes roseus]|uniref:Uncharacterized protein n=1 Tax=Rhodofomes roseus TaxID=34475 RepID=A0ABQ8K1Y9_9APHY|nr:uncharacterized protein C8Q71DRAFT_862229 [Rhodofomes roseus]KAH9830781.1 hypothetical protein C8Q71DRAFT_862229 [Rhodofomes roseus]